MALLTTWGAANRVVSAGLNVRYNCENSVWNGGDSTSGAPPQYTHSTITRICTKSYSYIGMTRAAAQQCLESMRNKYTREYADWQAIEKKAGENTAPYIWIDQRTCFRLTSSIEMAHENGDAWSVTVGVSETDRTITRSPVSTISALANLFAFANQRDYDEDTAPDQGIYINSATVTAHGTELSWNQNIAGYSSSNVTVERLVDSVWTAITGSGVYITGNTAVVPVSVRATLRVKHTSGSTVHTSNQVESQGSVSPTTDYAIVMKVTDVVSSTNAQLAFGPTLTSSGDYWLMLSSGQVPAQRNGHSLAWGGTGGEKTIRFQGDIVEIAGNGSAAWMTATNVSPTSITFGSSVTTIGKVAANVSTLTTVRVEAAESISASAFSGCGVTSFMMPNTLKADAQAMDGYPFGLSSGCVITCADGTITLA